jgi:hypothetical protein
MKLTTLMANKVFHDDDDSEYVSMMGSKNQNGSKNHLLALHTIVNFNAKMISDFFRNLHGRCKYLERDVINIGTRKLQTVTLENFIVP